MSLDEQLTRAVRHVADTVTPPSVDVDAVRSRAGTIHRRRLVAMAAVAIGCLVGGVAVASVRGGQVIPPVDKVVATNGVIVHADPSGLDFVDPLEIEELPAPGTASYPPWRAFDQESGRFLYTWLGKRRGDPRDQIRFGTVSYDPFVMQVVEPGDPAPLARIRCAEQCTRAHSFGPGPDEITFGEILSTGPPWTRPLGWQAVIVGLDGERREEIDLSAVLDGADLTDIEWSPDGSRLAVSTFTGSVEPICRDALCPGRVWVLDRGGDEPVLLHREDAQPSAYIEEYDTANAPILDDLAWSPDGTRLAWVSSTWEPDRSVDAGFPPTLVSVDVGDGAAQTIHEFLGCGDCSAYDAVMDPNAPRFAWAPDGTRIAVTSGKGIAQLSPSGDLLVAATGDERGQLAWLAEPAD